LVVQFGIIQPVEQVDGPRAGGGQANTHRSGEFGVGASHEGRHFLMARLDKRKVAVAIKCAQQSVYAVARVAEDSINTPCLESVDQKVTYIHSFVCLSTDAAHRRKRATGCSRYVFSY